MSVAVLRGDARALPLPDACVDLIVTSPPYFGLRSYTDTRDCPKCRDIRANGRDPRQAWPDYQAHWDRDHKPLPYDGQIGSEATPQEWVAALVACTAEWVRVLKPSGSIFVNLGDKYQNQGGRNGHTALAGVGRFAGNQPVRRFETDIPQKSLLGLPWRYAIACTDQLGLILRRDIIWSKPNGLPESVTDRCRSSHEYVFHMVKQPRYYAAVDEIREEHVPPSPRHYRPSPNKGMLRNGVEGGRAGGLTRDGWIAGGQNPLGKLPGSVWKIDDDRVWDIPSQPLTVPARLGVDHFASFPMELPRRVILGWSPPGVCVACGEGRRPVAERSYEDGNRRGTAKHAGQNGWGTRGAAVDWTARPDKRLSVAVTGYACACTPYTDHPGEGGSGERYGNSIDAGQRPSFPETPGPPSRLSTRPRAGGGREYHLDGWAPPPTRPAVVLDPFGGTGTTALVAHMHGRTGITIDRSADYTRLARWRCHDPAERAKALQVPKPPPVDPAQDALFTI